MAGGSSSSPNKIGGGYAPRLRATGVDLARERRWRNFGRGLDRRVPIEVVQAGRAAAFDATHPAEAEMAENCGFSLHAWGVVAPLASHGLRFVVRSQRLSV